MAIVLDSSCNARLHTAKSHTSIYDIYAPTGNDGHHSKHRKTCPIHELSGDPHRKYSQVRGSIRLYQTPYVTSEKYHALNKRSSDKSVVRSTSTLFYDLDNLAKRHSYDCVADFEVSTNNTLLNNAKKSNNTTGFEAKSKAIVQECTTEVQAKMTPRDSVAINRRIKKPTKSNSLISSDMFLNNTDYSTPNITRIHERDQKFWSYSKYKTEYTRPMSEERRRRLKHNDQNGDDPCPCQLFSYACPCTDKKSLTDLAKNSKTVTASNQVTTLKNTASYYKKNTTKDKTKSLVDKVTSPTRSEMLPEYNVARVSNQMSPQSIYHKKMSKHTCHEMRCNHSPKQKCYKKSRQIICPKCKERIEIPIITEEDDHMIFSHIQENTSPGQQSYVSSFSQRSKVDGDVCSHDPPCELVPVCQILPSEQPFGNSTKCFKMESKIKNNRTIKITKACRHHPPCTVVPSCQRMRVLSNNCEYIPPCLHRPRCVNLPLCIPFSKTIDYDELINKPLNEEDSLKCHHMYSTPAYVPVYEHESVGNNIQQHFHATHNPCEYANDYGPTFFLTPKLTRTSPTFSPNQNQSPTNKHSPMSCTCPKTNKSCQYECAECKCDDTKTTKKNESEDVIIYIRDVGCQFRNKHIPCSNLLQSNTSNVSFEEDTGQMGNYFSNYHTLRYEDKYTNPVSGVERTSISSSSLEIDSHCPSHGTDRKPHSEIITGFRPRISPIIANCSLKDPILEYCITTNKDSNKKRRKSQSILYTASSRKSFIKSKHKKSSVKRRRKSRLSYQSILNSDSKKEH
ncbi:unnamed protein product [Pieris brassicae]|uniref:Uncharacterized protein n=1 Tax=Pieris brassicae TaxID=7116 RepID=A0A9P0TB70_PIEBR|nr:unnamed protein product [Pieris brassicae]